MLAIVTTHPIQYQVPLWQTLAKNGSIPFEVWYLTDHGTRSSYDQEFATTFAWDVDTLTGYPYRFLSAPRKAKPTSFWACRFREKLGDRICQSGVKQIWIQGWQVAAYWQAAWAAKQAGAQLWLRGESNDLAPINRLKYPLKRLLLTSLFDRVDRFLCIGSANRRFYESYGVNSTRLYHAPYAVDNDRFARQAKQLRSDRASIRRTWGISDEAYCILFCGKLIPKKRPADVIAIGRALRDSGRIPEVHLLFAGDGMLGAQLRAQTRVHYDATSESGRERLTSSASNAGAPPASFVGFLNQADISRAYVAADCLVLPSDHGETWGLVVNEALASGLPCVVSNACGCAEDLLNADQVYPVGLIAEAAQRIVDVSCRSEFHIRSLPRLQDTVLAVRAAYGEECS